MEKHEIRAMVLDLALKHARETVESVKNAGLASGTYHEHGIEVEGGNWCISVTYISGQDIVNVEGHLHPDAEEMPMLGGLPLPPGLSLQRIGGEEDEEGSTTVFGLVDGRDGFDYTLPAGWLPKPVEA